ncbi:diglucosyldiacylglycerol synthase [Halalkalibacter wakoensis JCM 9140]|uniref:Diglucosyldiacylglycerol synthase n=1 Tax=Halalkalibacter wakoensis JCM 9140 TaxID=1236970 RepID=W4PZL7_9BACI|nr:glycosyltransferase [Halalkalibacter wakoensis]GAE25286.1 diglucosyldiacylglycerol synthase [Halalkalibacter wakoensis JCM 9140]
MSHITIFSASIGNGHNEASKALKDQFELQGETVTIVDTFQSIHPLLHKAFLELYLRMIEKTPKLWGRLYRYSEEYSWFLVLDQLGTFFCEKLHSIIHKNRTNVMISTHPFVTAFLAKLKKKKNLSLPLYTVITDLYLHPAYVRPEIDGYFTACPKIDHFASEHNLSLNQLFCTGIPIKEIPDVNVPRWKLRNDLELQSDEKTVLVSGGGLGLGKYEDILASLEKVKQPIQILCMIGMNKELERKIKTLTSKHRVHVIGYTDEFTKYLRASDLVISKAGGLTVSEALACETPLLIYEPVPGHEEDNAQFLLDCQSAFKAEQIEEIAHHTENILFNHAVYDQLVQNARKLKKPDAAKQIAYAIKRLTQTKQVL